MQDIVYRTITEATGATEIQLIEKIQELWSGYGSILRYRLTGSAVSSVIVKHVSFAGPGTHPRGWNTDHSHQRKLRSYQVETVWYSRWAHSCSESCRVPHCLAVNQHNSETVIVLEDLDSAGYPKRHQAIGDMELTACLNWLAWFHATFMGVTPDGLWNQGTYWHLETRPDELEALDDPALKKAAPKLDKMLRDCQYQTLVHGDAKLANFCFSQDGSSVAAVDFQYVGGGCGMKDLAYFVGSCLSEGECEYLEERVLNTYFHALEKALSACNPSCDFPSIEAEWRNLYPVAWTDFHRFLKGWSPGHWKLNTYSERVAQRVIQHLT